MNVAIITGASSGMGRRFAILLRDYFPEIDEIWLIGRNEKRLNKVSSLINVKTNVLSLDITLNRDLSVLNKALKANNPNIRILINCAGVGIIGNFEKIKHSDVNSMITTNCLALTNITGLCLPFMNRGARIINLSSSAAFVPQSGFAVYAATKSYVLNFSEALSRELRNRDIHVISVCPGTVKTPFIKNAEKYQKIKFYKKLFMSSEEKVVKKALKDSFNNKSRSVYGLTMKMFMVICKILPSRFILKFMK